MRKIQSVQAYRCQRSPYSIVVVASNSAEAKDVARQWANEAHGVESTDFEWSAKRTHTLPSRQRAEAVVIAGVNV